MRFIKLVFDSPLQSWGDDARWDYRSTYDMPTKSGITGLLACCLGYKRCDARIQALSSSIKVSCRADRQGIVINDFHTAQSRDGRFLNSEGAPRCDTLIFPHLYLEGAKFTVLIWGDEAILDACYSALMHPHWSPYLGRKCCVPATPLQPEWVNAEDIDAAWQMIPAESSGRFRIQTEYSYGERLDNSDHLIEMRDEVIDGTVNEYKARMVREHFAVYGGEI